MFGYGVVHPRWKAQRNALPVCNVAQRWYHVTSGVLARSTATACACAFGLQYMLMHIEIHAMQRLQQQPQPRLCKMHSINILAVKPKLNTWPVKHLASTRPACLYRRMHRAFVATDRMLTRTKKCCQEQNADRCYLVRVILAQPRRCLLAQQLVHRCLLDLLPLLVGDDLPAVGSLPFPRLCVRNRNEHVGVGAPPLSSHSRGICPHTWR